MSLDPQQPPDSPAPQPAFLAVPPSRPSALFGPYGLRAGWGILLFLPIFLLIAGALYLGEAAVSHQLGPLLAGQNAARQAATRAKAQHLPPGNPGNAQGDPGLDAWNRALPRCTSSPLTSIWIGDSTAVVYRGDGGGAGPNNPLNRFAEQQRLYLQQRCGAHGTGFVPYIKFLIPWSPNPNRQFYGPGSGTVVQDATVGPYHTFAGNDGVLARATTNGASIDWTSALVNETEDRIKVACVSGPGLHPWSIVVRSHADGRTVLGAGTCGGSAASLSVPIATIGTWAAQSVDVGLTCATAPCVYYATAGYSGTKGAIVHNLGAASGFAEDYLVPGGMMLIDAIVAEEGASIIQTDFGTNEALNRVPAATFGAALTQIGSHLLAYPNPPSVLNYVMPVCGSPGCASMTDMSRAAQAVSTAQGTAFLSMVDAWRSQYIPAAYDRDGVHASDRGALAQWDRIRAAEIGADPGVPTRIVLPPASQVIRPAFAAVGESAQALGCLAAAAILAFIERRRFYVYGMGLPHLRDLLPGAFWGLASISALIGLLCACHALVFDARLLDTADALRYGALWLLIFLFVGVFEEFLFRGYIQFTLTRGLMGLGERLYPRNARAAAFWLTALLLSTLFFGAHIMNSGETPAGLAGVFMAGIVFSYALWRTGSLWWGVGFHMTWDWAQSFLFGVPDSGTISDGRLFGTHALGRAWLSGGGDGPEGSVLLLPVLALVLVVLRLTRKAEPPPLEPLEPEPPAIPMSVYPGTPL